MKLITSEMIKSDIFKFWLSNIKIKLYITKLKVFRQIKLVKERFFNLKIFLLISKRENKIIVFVRGLLKITKSINNPNIITLM